METSWNPLTERQKLFFANLKKYLKVTPYFFGSIQRCDYIPGVSDIDVDIFSTNPDLIAHQLSNMFTGSMFNYYRINWLFDNNYISGYKVKYTERNSPSFKVEFSIYNETLKPIVLEKHLSQIYIPFHYSLLLYVMKLCMKKSSFYYKVKKWLLSPNDKFTIYK